MPQVEVILLRAQQSILRASPTHQGPADGRYLIYSLLAVSEFSPLLSLCFCVNLFLFGSPL